MDMTFILFLVCPEINIRQTRTAILYCMNRPCTCIKSQQPISVSWTRREWQIIIFIKFFLPRRKQTTVHIFNMKIDNAHYYIDRCELWGFFHEINSGISHVRYHFFPAGTTFTQLQVWWLRPLFIYSEYTYDCKLKKFREMLLTTLSHNQHNVIDVIWRLPVWNVKIRRYLASCTLHLWSNLTKICFQGRHFNYFCVLW
jgi:hypothetical protein